MDQEISEGPRAVGDHPVADAGAGAGRLGDQGGDRDDLRHARHALHQRARSRDLLYAVPAQSGRHPRAYPGLRHHALHAARLGSADGRVPLENPSRPVPHQRQGHAVVGRGRMPWRLRQRADGDDFQGHVRGSDAGAACRDHRPLRCRQGRLGDAGAAERPHHLRADHRSDDAEERKGNPEDDPRQGSQGGCQGRQGGCTSGNCRDAGGSGRTGTGGPGRAVESQQAEDRCARNQPGAGDAFSGKGRTRDGKGGERQSTAAFGRQCQQGRAGSRKGFETAQRSDSQG